MAQENEVILKVRMSTKEAEKGLEKVQKNIEDTNKELKKNIDNFGFLGVTIGDVKNKFADLRQIGGQALTVIKQQGQQAALGLRLMFGGKMKAGASALFKTIKVGIASTGIGLLVVAFGSLVTFLTKTDRGAKLLKQGLAAVGAAVSAVTDRISKVGEAVSKLFRGDLKGAAESVRGTFKGLGDEIAREVKLSIELEKAAQNLKDVQRDLNVETAQRRAEIEGLKLIAEDVTKTEKERIDAAKQALEIESGLMNRRVQAAEEDVRISKERVGMNESTQEDLDELAEKEIRLAEIRGESLGKSIELNNKVNSIEAEIETKRKENHQKELDRIEEQKVAADELATKKLAIEDQITIAQAEEGRERELKALELAFERAQAEEEDFQLLMLMATKYAQDRAAIDAKFDAITLANKKKTDQDKIDLEKEIVEVKQDLAMNALSQLGEIAGRESGIGKAAAVAETIINTHKSATASYSSLAGIPIVGPGLGAIAAGLAVTSGMMSVQKIMATPKPDTSTGFAQGGLVGGMGGGTSDSINTRLSRGESVINARSTRMFQPFLSAINEAGGGRGFDGGLDEGSGGMTAGLVKAFVVTDDLTQSQDKLSKIRRKATI
jgi:hypothetical protein